MVFDDTVDADVESVVTWWFHPDRRAEYLDLAQTRGALDLTVERTREGGRAVMRLRYRSAQGWEFDHRLEADLDEVGMPRSDGDGFRYEARDLETARSGNQHFTVTCVALHEFVAIGPKETRITQTHTHTMTGGRWLWRRNRRRRDHATHRRGFTTKVGQCRTALGTQPGMSPTTS